MSQTEDSGDLWLVPAILQTLSSLVSPYCKASRAAQKALTPQQVTDFVCSHSRDCSHVRALAVDTSREKG